jgi:hypothetical protein
MSCQWQPRNSIRTPWCSQCIEFSPPTYDGTSQSRFLWSCPWSPVSWIESRGLRAYIGPLWRLGDQQITPICHPSAPVRHVTYNVLWKMAESKFKTVLGTSYVVRYHDCSYRSALWTWDQNVLRCRISIGLKLREDMTIWWFPRKIRRTASLRIETLWQLFLL